MEVRVDGYQPVLPGMFGPVEAIEVERGIPPYEAAFVYITQEMKPLSLAGKEYVIVAMIRGMEKMGEIQPETAQQLRSVVHVVFSQAGHP